MSGNLGFESMASDLVRWFEESVEDVCAYLA